ncbi:hypothetical protein SAMN05445504_7126 [Burkholderia sp. CF099]|nr:hypothetical protein SAMN05445504_7126 [Burkholderia sp. CF099]
MARTITTGGLMSLFTLALLGSALASINAGALRLGR